MNKVQVATGAVHAICNARQRLLDACCLLESGRRSGTFVMAAFAREELGRHKRLVDKALGMGETDSVSATDIRNMCKDHVDKLRHGQTKVSAQLPGDLWERWVKAVHDPQTPESRAVFTKADDILRRKALRDPSDIHSKRKLAQYVDALDDDSWSRPDNVEHSEVVALIRSVSVDYANHIYRYVFEVARSMTLPGFPEHSDGAAMVDQVAASVAVFERANGKRSE